ncbi:MAG: adenosine deaminase [Woeseia sp.]|nr:adenosine deaminase [Woeseia sp.]|tara:strand:- start:1409 stop:2815 length:1407 start_codon:yes stop_codon:yes gene_type:complete
MINIRRFFLIFFVTQIANADWFDDIKTNGNSEDLYRVLYYMPKGGDLHNHLTGAVFSEWWYDLALKQKSRGYEYYTKVRIENCREYGGDQFSRAPYYLMFRNITAHDYAKLDDCEKTEYKRLEELNQIEKTAWMNSIRLDKPHEGRDEFFQTHWNRLNALVQNPWLQAEIAATNIKAYAEEGMAYVEYQVSEGPYSDFNGEPIHAPEAFQILRARLNKEDVVNTGLLVKFQISILRFLPNAEDRLRTAYKLVNDNSDLFVAVNMVGREDNDKGYPLRFLNTLRELRHQYSGVKLSIHAGEVDEPNFHIRDTLHFGANRIGHGINLITDPDTMLLMRYGPYMVEINLISNLLLNYVSDYKEHPFPEYLRTGIPVALSSDDRGMWDSTMTDEFFVGTTEFNLSWDEIKMLSRTSLQHAFIDQEIKEELLEDYNGKIQQFEQHMQQKGLQNLDSMPKTRGFICRHYELCAR